MIRSSTRYVSYKDIKAVMTDLKKIYGAVSEEAPSTLLRSSRKNGTPNTRRFINLGRPTGLIYQVSSSIRMKCAA